jgi:hypothetical protein
MLSVTRLAADVASTIWPPLAARFQQVWRWLIAPRDPLNRAILRVRGARLIYLLSSTYGARLAVATGISLVLLLVLPWHAQERFSISKVWDFYTRNRDALTPALAPLGTILVGLGTIAVGIGTMRVNRQQAKTSAQQAVTTAFYNAVSRLASDKIEERLGGIYMLERISRDSLDDHWTVMETLTAFIRERTQPEAERRKNWLGKRQRVRWPPKTGQAAKRESSLGTAGWPEVRLVEYTEEAQS